jgi:hypothetical protein
MLGSERPEHTLADLDRVTRFSPLWRAGVHGEGITVAVLDSGIAATAILGDRLTEPVDFAKPIAGQRDNSHGTEMAVAIHRVAPRAQVASLRIAVRSTKLRARTLRPLLRAPSGIAFTSIRSTASSTSVFRFGRRAAQMAATCAQLSTPPWRPGSWS